MTFITGEWTPILGGRLTGGNKISILNTFELFMYCWKAIESKFMINKNTIVANMQIRLTLTFSCRQNIKKLTYFLY